MTAHADWAAYPEGMDAIAPHIGPFASRPFLEAVSRHTSPDRWTLHIEASNTGAAGIVEVDGCVELVGRSDLTDYHSPIGLDGARAVADALARFPTLPFRLDSLPSEAAEPISVRLAETGIEHLVRPSEVTAVVDLPGSYDEWLISLAKKQRHEVRRKVRRFEAEFGELSIERHTIDALDTFVSMHRTSAGKKGAFMTESMAGFFRDLVETAGASINLLVCNGEARAAAFGFETDDGYYFYNSAFDPLAKAASPGIVLLAAMVEAQIERGVSVFDFLKGDERYKFQHGAVARQLYEITGGRDD